MMNNDNCNNRNGHNIVVISGPSGSGKSTLIRRLMKRHTEIVFSTSHTTRKKRGRELNGKDYHFVSKNEFKEMRDRDGFVEWAQVYENYYGTSYAEIDSKLTAGKILILDIDVQGARNIKEKYPDALFIFLVPPTIDELKDRLMKREHGMNNTIQVRLDIAVKEFKEFLFYDYIVVNEDLNEAYRVLDSVYVAHMNRSFRHKAFMKERLLVEVDE